MRQQLNQARPERVEQFATANSLFRKILPATPFPSRFWPDRSRSATPNSNEFSNLEISQKKSAVIPLCMVCGFGGTPASRYYRKIAAKNPLSRWRNPWFSAFFSGAGGGCTTGASQIDRADKSSAGRSSTTGIGGAAGTAPFAARLFAVKTNGASTWTWTSPGCDGGTGSVSGPFDKVIDPVASAGELPEAFSAGVEDPPIRAFASNADSGLGGVEVSVCNTCRGAGHPHSTGTLLSTLSIWPA